MIALEFCEYIVEECPWGEKFCSCKKTFEEVDNFEPSPVDEEWWNKGVRNHPDGSTSWINPDLLDGNGQLKKFDKYNPEEDDLPF